MLKEGKNKIVPQDVLYNNEYIEKRRHMSKHEKHCDNINVHLNDIKEYKRSYQTSALTQILSGPGENRYVGRASTVEQSRTEGHGRTVQKATQPVLENPYSLVEQEKYRATWSAKKSDLNNLNTVDSHTYSQERIRPLTAIGSIHIPGLIRNHKSICMARGSSCGSIAATGTGDEQEHSFRN